MSNNAIHTDGNFATLHLHRLFATLAKSKFQKQNTKRLEEFLVPFEILSYDEIASKYYGTIRYQLESKGELIGPLDMLIGAHALSRDLILITNNEKAFKRIKSLKIENWTN